MMTPLHNLLYVLPLCLPVASDIKIYAAGSGTGMLSKPETASEIVALSGIDKPNVLYLGTSKYDREDCNAKQTDQLAALGCNVSELLLAYETLSSDEIQAAFDPADVNLVSGGNTRFAVDRFVELGIDKLMKEAAERGAVLAGGSAGEIVWLDGGHSDSMDPTSYKVPPGPLINPSFTDDELKSLWTYIRVNGISALPGLFCPHYDKAASNGIPRAESFSNMMRHNAGEYSIGVDNWAAIEVDDDDDRLISRANETGSVGPDGTFNSNATEGTPGAWIVSINPDDGSLICSLVQAEGEYANLFREARCMTQDEMLPVSQKQNPFDWNGPTTSELTSSAVGVQVYFWAAAFILTELFLFQSSRKSR